LAVSGLAVSGLGSFVSGTDAVSIRSGVNGRQSDLREG
jgi:hypothetical protein